MRNLSLLILIAGLLLTAGATVTVLVQSVVARVDTQTSQPARKAGPRPFLPVPPGRAVATFAGGCFWCLEKPLEDVPGVYAVISGYTGGDKMFPTYKEVCSGKTGHTEAVQVHFDPARVPYSELLQVFWRTMDPTDIEGQFVDRGNQYRPEIFYHDVHQKAVAQASRAELAKSERYPRPVKIAITAASRFYPAEDYHQDYYKKNPSHYRRYRNGSGRDAFLKKIWGDDLTYEVKPPKDPRPVPPYRKPSTAELKALLTPLQFDVTQKDGTERSFKNEFWDNKEPGLYVDIVSGEPLFSSKDKFKSGTGWPSFTRPVAAASIVEKTDHKIGYPRTEVRSKHADSHLGHVFKDGPEPTGLRYCINSAALRFIPKSELRALGYGEYVDKFE